MNQHVRALVCAGGLLLGLSAATTPARAQADTMTVGRVVRGPQTDSARRLAFAVQRNERAAPPDGGLEQFVFPPDRVMQYQDRIGLSADQRLAVRNAVREMQSKTLELQWKLQDESEKLVDLLKRATVSEPDALNQVDRVLSAEREVKRAQMGMLIKIKNSLSPEQQAQLRRLREEDEASGRKWGGPGE